MAQRKVSIAGDEPLDTPSPLLMKLPEIEGGVAQTMIPAERAIMLRMVAAPLRGTEDEHHGEQSAGGGDLNSNVKAREGHGLDGWTCCWQSVASPSATDAPPHRP